MATTAKASEHIKPCNISQSERHNRRDADYIASLNPAMLYIRKDLAHLNEVYVAPDMVGVSLQQHYDDIRIMVKQKTGRAMQEKDVKFTDKKGKQRVRQGCSPIREGVVNIKPDTTMEDLLRYAERVHERWGIRALQIHIHKDEGHYEVMEQREQCQANLNIAESRQNSAEPDTEDPASWEPNYHAHIIWDWMDHDTGKSFKLNAEDMSAIQDLVAETLDMQRGQKKSETGIDHLERNDFIILKQENKKKQLQEEAKKAIAEKEEANAEVEAAKTEVADLWKEHDYLTSANRTKVERSNRLDLDIRTKTNRSQSLDCTIEAKKQEVGKLSAKADEKGMVARLYLNRLKKNMKLQADPTVKFAIGDFALRRLRLADTRIESPWNTYYVEGLPPGPICIPEKSSIDAVLDAPEHDYIYMCAKEDFSGYHNFAVTYSDHEANAKRYQKALDERNITR